MSVKLKKMFSQKLGRCCPAGLIASSPTGTGVGDIEGPLEVFLAGLIGAFAGFVLGMLIGVLTRLFTMNAIKGCRGGMHWAAYGAGAGAMALAIIELLD